MGVRAVTFDVYSALFDTHAGLAEALARLVQQRGVTYDVELTAWSWRAAHKEYLLLWNSLHDGGASNRIAIEVSARHVLRHLDPPLAPEEVEMLVGAWERLPLWPETVEVLQEVRARVPLVGVVSNGDRAMLESLLRSVPVRFDRIVSTEGGKYKPHPSVYARALEALGVGAPELLHVAGSATDAMGATAAGIRTLWVNRSSEAVVDPRLAPRHEARTLRGILDLLGEV